MTGKISHLRPDPSATTPLDDFRLLASLTEVLTECKARFTKESPFYRADPANISRLNQWVQTLLNHLDRMNAQYEAVVAQAAGQREGHNGTAETKEQEPKSPACLPGRYVDPR